MTVTVYTKPACVQCNATYKALDKQGIAYDVVDITEVPEARDYVMALGYLQAPVVVAPAPAPAPAQPVSQHTTHHSNTHHEHESDHDEHEDHEDHEDHGGDDD